MNNPKVSIIIPVYNAEKYLRECLDSAVGQTLDDIEIICINDGSTDNSARILKEYAAKDSRVKVITQKNQGVSAARNAGLAAVSGDFIAFCDNDDNMDLSTFEKACNAMTPDVDLVVWDVKVIPAADELIAMAEGTQNYICKFPQGRHDICFETINRNTIFLWHKLFRTEIIKKYDIKFPDGLFMEDNQFIYEYVGHAGKMFYIDEALYNYILRPTSTTANLESDYYKKRDPLNALKIWKNIFEHYKEHELVKKHEQQLQSWLKYYFDYGYSRASFQDKPKIKEFMNICVSEFVYYMDVLEKFA